MKNIRASKFRHIAGSPAPSDEHQRGVRIGAISPDANVLKANADFLAFPWPLPGSICVVPHGKRGAIEEEPPVLQQEQSIVEFAFNPFNNRQLVTAGQDGAVRIFEIPEGGLTSVVSTPVLTFQASEKRLLLAEYHPLAQNVMCTAAGDYSFALFDLNRPEEAVLRLPASHTGLVSSVSWNRDGSLLTTACKDKKLRIFDPRANAVVATVADHAGAKAFRALWYGSKDRIVSCGFTKESEREIAVWDPRDMSKRAETIKIDHNSASMLPFADEDLGLLYVGGKGEGVIRIYEFDDKLYPCTEFKSNVSTSGLALLPKARHCNKAKCEVARFAKLTPDSIVPLRFEVPRAGAEIAVQADLYPPTWDLLPTSQSEEWFGGVSNPPNLVDQLQ